MDANSLLPKHIDYQAIGFKCGLEIHRRMKGKKLFCLCDAEETEDAKETSRFLRELRISQSEEGRIDQAALEAFKKRKYYEYVVYDKGVCLVEMDEQPPYHANPDLVKKTLKLAKYFSCSLPNEIIFMRKIVVDGSNTSGFQRTALIGINGKLNDHVGIETICLEEESAQIIERSSEKDVYDLRRLGIGLVEIATTPTIKDDKDAYETAKLLGETLKFTGFFQRGLGSIRQDLNISIAQGARVEIKGVQDLDLIPVIVRKEVIRQLSLIKFQELMKDKKLKVSNLINVSERFKNSESKLFKGKEVWAFSIENFRGIFGLKITPTKTLGNEIAGYVKAVTKAKGFIHTDEDIRKYRIENEVADLLASQDLYIFVIGAKDIADEVRDAIVERLSVLMQRVPEETRKVEETGDTSYLRKLPGAARMYPETDVPPIPVTPELMKEIDEMSMPTKDEVIRYLSDVVGNEELVKQLVNSKYLDYFLEYRHEIDVKKVVKLLLTEIKGKEREYGFDFMKLLPKSHLLIKAYMEGKITKEGVSLALRDLNNGNDLDEILKRYEKIEVAKVLEEVKDMAFKDAMAYVRQRYEGRVDIAEVAKKLSRLQGKNK